MTHQFPVEGTENALHGYVCMACVWEDIAPRISFPDLPSSHNNKHNSTHFLMTKLASLLY